jgi:hypothetical protein
MILSAYLTEAGFFRWTSWRILRAVSSPRALLWGWSSPPVVSRLSS